MLRIYVDTSVFGGVLDEEFCAPSRGLIERAVRGEIRFLLSDLAVEELTNAPQREPRDGLSANRHPQPPRTGGEQ